MLTETMSDRVRQQLDDLYREDFRRILSTLIRLLGDFDLAEDALQEAFRLAMEQWPLQGIPENSRAWLISTGRFKAIDSLRHHARSSTSLDEMDESSALLAGPTDADLDLDSVDIQDDRLRLIFTCCHPSLPGESRIALTLREVCGLSTEAIAHAYLTNPITLAQRIVRAKARLRSSHIQYQVPSLEELPGRLDAVLQVIYLVFNEGYYSSTGSDLLQPDLSGEAIHLGRLLMELFPQPEVAGLLALMLLHESRRTARTNLHGDLVLLEDQDRNLWDRALISEGTALLQRILLSGQPFGPYGLQAVISALHSSSPTFAATDWPQIVACYDRLLKVMPSPVVELNRAVAVAMLDGPEIGLGIIDTILARGDLADYHLAYSARAELYRRLGNLELARISYQKALALARLEPEKRFIQQKLMDLAG